MNTDGSGDTVNNKENGLKELNGNGLSLFSHKLNLSFSEVLLRSITGLILVPIRLLLALLIALFTWGISGLGVLARDKTDFDLRPQDGWRGMCREIMYTTMSTVIFWCLGFKLNIIGQQAHRRDAPIVIAAPHTSFLDVFMIAVCRGSPLARIENSRTPAMSAIQTVGHTIFVDRRSSESRQAALKDIVERAHSKLDWPPVFIFSEGTTSNGTALIRFQSGGFRAGLPVQPVTIQYSHPNLTTWTRDQSHGFLTSFLLLLAIPVKTVNVHFLPVYYPSKEEKVDPILFASLVQQTMAQSLGIPATDIQRQEFVHQRKDQ